ncbi:hypothetical protein LXL04_015623 [Taraxacum kok-saghyz]
MGDKITWSQEQLKCLLETCIEEVNKVGRKGLSMHKDSWTKLGCVFKERFGMELSQKQMKNCYDNLKAKYIGWTYLKNKTGIEQALEHLMKVPIKPKIPTIPECVEKLQVLQLEPEDPLRLAAYHVFGGVTSAREL